MDMIDLRSDTVTHPTPAMREAMATAPVGDDVFGDDPTVNALQDYAAELLGKQAALFVASGTQGNVIACLTHCQRGEELIVGKEGHIFRWEVGAASALGGIAMHQVRVQANGEILLEDIAAAIRNSSDVHHPITKLVCLENTQGGVGGVPLTARYVQSVADFCHQRGLQLHIDGARLFNAAAAVSVEPITLVKDADSVQICLSKGLCAPAGSLLLGRHDFIDRARRVRKMLGGGMRQAGVLAAAGLIGLRDMRQRLAEDHIHAEMLAQGLAQIRGISVHPVSWRTNMVFFSIPENVESAHFVSTMKEQGILLTGGPKFRAVTHYWISKDRIERILKTVSKYMAERA